MRPSAFTVALTILYMLRGFSIAHSATDVVRDHASTTSYRIERQYMLGGLGGWDYLAIDPIAKRLFISRSDRVLIVSTRDGSLEATIPDTPGVHGIALASDLGKGYTSNGLADTVTEFDLKSLARTSTIAIKGHNPDAILYDSFSRHVFTFNGRSQDVSVIDPRRHRVIARIPVGGKPEFAVSDSQGRIFFNIETTARLGVIDPLTRKVTAAWSLPGCANPSGLALDVTHRRLFSVCANGILAVTDAVTGKQVASLPIGQGPDAAAFDPERELIFSSNGKDGTLTVIHEDNPNHYTVVANIKTEKNARTLALDVTTHEIYLVTAQFDDAPKPMQDQRHPRPAIIDGTFKVLVLGD